MISPLFLSALLFSLSFFRIFVDAEELIKFAEIGTCLPDEFYNVNLLQCSKCSHLANLVPTEDGFSCKCNAASVIVPTVGGEFPRCQKCPEDHEPSFDQRECVPCANLVTTTEEPNSTAVSLCASCPANHISVSTEWSGILSQTPRCVACAPGFKARENLGAFGLCEPCNLRSSLDVSANCSCPVKSHELLRPPDEPPLCVPKSSLVNWPVTEKLAQVQFDTETVTSQLIKDRLRPSAILCQLGNRTACQFVANLCALNVYNDDDSGPSACKTFRDAKRTLAGAVVSGTEARPWLLYGDGDAPSVLAKRKLSPLKFTLTRNSNVKLIS